jgi:hypothetical protein
MIQIIGEAERRMSSPSCWLRGHSVAPVMAGETKFLIVVPSSRQTSSRLVEYSRTHTNGRFR